MQGEIGSAVDVWGRDAYSMAADQLLKPCLPNSTSLPIVCAATGSAVYDCFVV